MFMHYKIAHREKYFIFSKYFIHSNTYIHTHIYFSSTSQIFLSYLITQYYHFLSQVCSAKRWDMNGPKYKRKIIIIMKLQHIKGTFKNAL